MKNLAQKVLNALKNIKNLDTAQKDIEKYQSNLMKNINSKLLDKNEKNKLLTVYTNLHDIGKSLYKYNVLKKNNQLAVAEEEKEEIKHKVLKGYICNVKYVWRSEHGEHTCDECESMDGEEFESYEDIPPQPHPNCKCYIEILECPYEPEYSPDDDVEDNNEENPQPQKPQEEPCDAIYEIEYIISTLEGNQNDIEVINDNMAAEIQFLEEDVQRLENAIEDAEKILDEHRQEYGNHIAECPYNIDEEYDALYENKVRMKNLIKDILGILSPATTILRTIEIFVSNYFELLYHAYNLKEAEMDKYYHSKANCEATQELGILGEKTAEALSDIKEYYDQYTYVHTHRVTVEEAIADSERDQAANRLGRKRGRNNPNCSCSELMKDLLPNYKK